MLTIGDVGSQRTCAGLSRRDFLRVGTLGLGGMGLGGLTLFDWLALKARAADLGVSVRDKSVVLLFLHGGPSHIEFFDPKMDAPSEIRSVTGEIPTTLPGVTFGGTFPKLARRADDLAVVRSYQSRNSGHTYQRVLSAGNPLKATLGALYGRIAGMNDSTTGLPNVAKILPEAVSKTELKLRRNFETQALPGLTSPGSLGEAYEAFDPAGGGKFQESLDLRISKERFNDRHTLLAKLDRIRRDVDSGGSLEGTDRYRTQAYDMIVRGVKEAFDLSKEDPKTVEKYDTTGLFDMATVNRYNDMFRSSNLLGHQMLLARRLCEAGCGFVTVSDAGWDMHGNNNSLPRLTGLTPLGHQVDHAVAAFLDDIRERGLSEKVLLVVTGEMGRTPRINGRGGRDHYGNLTSLLFAGGGLNMGQVIGRSDSHATHPASEPYGPENLMATIMNYLFDLGQLRLVRGIPQDVFSIISKDQPIRELF